MYKALLNKAGFNPPNRNVNISRMFSLELRTAMINYEEKDLVKARINKQRRSDIRNAICNLG